MSRRVASRKSPLKPPPVCTSKKIMPVSLVEPDPLFYFQVWGFRVLNDDYLPEVYDWPLLKQPTGNLYGGTIFTPRPERLSASVNIHHWPDDMTLSFDYKNGDLPSTFYLHGLGRGEYNCAWQWPLITMSLGPWPSPVVHVLLFANFPERTEI